MLPAGKKRCKSGVRKFGELECCGSQRSDRPLILGKASEISEVRDIIPEVWQLWGDEITL